MKRRVIVAAALCSLFLFAATAAAFNLETRKSIVSDAASFCPAELQAYLDANMDTVTDGMIFDYMNKKKIDPRQIDIVYNLLVERLRGGMLDDPATIRGFGVLAAMITEAVAPGYLNSSDDLDPPLVEYDGFTEITDPQGRVKELIISHKAFYGDKRDIITMPAYETSVNDIADLWTTAWKAAGLEAGLMAEAGKRILREEMSMTGGASDGVAAPGAAPAPGGAPSPKQVSDLLTGKLPPGAR